MLQATTTTTKTHQVTPPKLFWSKRVGVYANENTKSLQSLPLWHEMHVNWPKSSFSVSVKNVSCQHCMRVLSFCISWKLRTWTSLRRWRTLLTTCPWWATRLWCGGSSHPTGRGRRSVTWVRGQAAPCSNRREEVVISRLHTGHSYMTCFFFIEGRGAASVAYCYLTFLFWF